MAEQANSGGIVITRLKGRGIYEGPPGGLGWNHLVTPDEYQGIKKFDVNIHYDERGQAVLKATIQKVVCDVLWPQFQEDALKLAGDDAQKVAKAKKALTKYKGDTAAADWVDDHLKMPPAASPNQDPYIKFDQKLLYTKFDRSVGQRVEVERTMVAWDKDGNMLDLKAMNLGRGSVVTPILGGSLFMSAIMPPQPSLKLIGVRVLQAVTYGGNSGPGNLSAIDPDELAGIVGGEFEAEDLSGFLYKGPATKQADGAGPSEDLEDIPF